MDLARVDGTVVSTIKTNRLQGHKLLVVSLVDAKVSETGEQIVAVDTVGAGFGEIVLIVRGSSARQTEKTERVPTDTTIVGIVDSVVFRGQVVFDKQSRKEQEDVARED